MESNADRKTRCIGAFYCACSVNFSLIRETAAMRLRRFPARESRKKRSSKIRRKKQWFEYLRQPFSHFFFCNVDGSGKSLKLLCDVWKEVIFRMQKIVRVLSRDCLGDRWRWCYFWRMQVACRRVQKNWIVYFYRVIAISSYRWSFEVLAFL